MKGVYRVPLTGGLSVNKGKNKSRSSSNSHCIVVCPLQEEYYSKLRKEGSTSRPADHVIPHYNRGVDHVTYFLADKA
jgi:hypothetical protein